MYIYTMLLLIVVMYYIVILRRIIILIILSVTLLVIIALVSYSGKSIGVVLWIGIYNAVSNNRTGILQWEEYWSGVMDRYI